MATLRQIIQAFSDYVESAPGLGLTCIKGYPDFARLNLQPPVSAVFYGGSAVPGADTARKRVGASATAVNLVLGIYAANEVNLFELAAKLQTMREGRVVLTAGTDNLKIKVYVGADERQPPDADAVKEERHVITCPVVLVYE